MAATQNDGEQGQRADAEDKQKSETPPEERPEKTPLWKQAGPGLVTGAACDDPSAIGTFSTAGAQFGYGLLWLSLFVTPLIVAVQEMCGRLGRVTGQGLAGVIAKHYPRWVVWVAAVLVTGVCTITVWADLDAMAGSVQLLAHGPRAVWLVGLAAGPKQETGALQPLQHRRQRAGIQAQAPADLRDGDAVLLPEDEEDEVLRIGQPEPLQQRPVGLGHAMRGGIEGVAELVIQQQRIRLPFRRHRLGSVRHIIRLSRSTRRHSDRDRGLIRIPQHGKPPHKARCGNWVSGHTPGCTIR